MTQNPSLSNDTLRTAMYELALANKVPEADVLDDMIGGSLSTRTS